MSREKVDELRELAKWFDGSPKIGSIFISFPSTISASRALRILARNLEVVVGQNEQSN